MVLEVVKSRPDLVRILASLGSALVTLGTTTNFVDSFLVSLQVVLTGEALLSLATGHITSMWFTVLGQMLSDVMMCRQY